MTLVGVGVDLSLSRTGLTIARGNETPRTQNIKSDSVDATQYWQSHARIVDIVARIVKQVRAVKQVGDLVIINIEEPAFSPTGQKMVHVRDGLWWLAYHFLAKEGLVVTTQIQHLKQYATGNGGADKHAMVLASERAYPLVGVMNDDQADASWLCAMVMRAGGHPFEVSAQRCHPRYLDKVTWPDTLARYVETLP